MDRTETQGQALHVVGIFELVKDNDAIFQDILNHRVKAGERLVKVLTSVSHP